MEVSELDIAIDELEMKVERLRSLYEQYFMGIEKIPPSVAQKDVDRRIYVLRRTQIRNTAKRFKLQTIIQRYNTFQQYWMRILREIEHGTYRRHVLRAEKTVGISSLLTAAERKRLGLPDPSTASPAPPDSLAPADALSPAAVRSQIERELGLTLDEDLNELPSLGAFDLAKELDDPLLSSLPPAPRRRRPSLRAKQRSGAPASERQPSASSTGPSKAERPSREPEAAAPSSQRKSIRPAPVLTIDPPSPDGRSARTTNAMPPVMMPGPPPPRPAPMMPGTPPPRPAGTTRTMAPYPAAAPAPVVEGPPAPQKPRLPLQSAVAGRGLPPPQSAIAGRGLPPAPKRPELQTSPANASPQSGPLPKPTVGPAREAPAPESRPRGLPDIRESVAPGSTRPKTVPKAEPTRPMFERPAPAKATPDPAKGGALDRANVERLASKLTEARKQTNENTPVAIDALARKLEATAAELQKKHVGRRIDFDVIVKDGRAILKPIVR